MLLLQWQSAIMPYRGRILYLLAQHMVRDAYCFETIKIRKFGYLQNKGIQQYHLYLHWGLGHPPPSRTGHLARSTVDLCEG